MPVKYLKYHPVKKMTLHTGKKPDFLQLFDCTLIKKHFALLQYILKNLQI